MMQHKFLLFTAVCCCLLQVMLCDLPKSARLRSLSRRSSFSSAAGVSSPVRRSDTQEIQSQSATIKKEDSSEEPVSEKTPVVEETPSEDPVEEESSEKDEVVADQSSPSKKKKSKTARRKKSFSKDRLNIADLNELKERSKEVIRDLLRDQNANEAVTLLVTNTRDLLKNKFVSKVIVAGMNFLTDVLTSEAAKQVIYDIRMDILKTFIDEKTPEKVTYASEKAVEYLSQETLPGLMRKRFGILKKFIENDKTYPAFETLKDGVVNFMKTADIKRQIAKGFHLLDFGLHFDPNNITKSLGLSIFKR